VTISANYKFYHICRVYYITQAQRNRPSQPSSILQHTAGIPIPFSHVYVYHRAICILCTSL